jgi:lysine-specific demethylase/histidyl-hydroxylase NO66
LAALELLAGDARAFVDKVWATHVHLHHTDPAELVGLLSLDDVDHLLTGTALRTPALRVVKNGSVLPSARFTRSARLAGSPLTGLVDARTVLSLFDDGATVVLQGLHRYWPPLTALVRDLELALGHPCQANAYLTPPGSQGFARHSDTHDVFVFQTHGRKEWQVVEGTGQGTGVGTGAGTGAGTSAGMSAGTSADTDEREVVLEPGLSLYLPTGTPHSARSQEETSLHVTVGVNRLTWREALRGLGDRVLAEERYDAPLPAGYLDDPARLAARLAEELDAFTGSLRELDAAVVADERAAAFLSERTPALRGGLTDLVRLPQLDDETVLERRATAACVLQPGPERLVVLLGDRELRMPLRLAGPMRLVRDTPCFRVRDLAPWLDLESRLVLTRRLVREGLLRIAR